MTAPGSSVRSYRLILKGPDGTSSRRMGMSMIGLMPTPSGMPPSAAGVLSCARVRLTLRASRARARPVALAPTMVRRERPSGAEETGLWFVGMITGRLLAVQTSNDQRIGAVDLGFIVHPHRAIR